jgi:hypothetical protein
LAAKGPVPDGGDSVRHFKRAVELYPQNAKYWYNLAEAYRGNESTEMCVYLYTIAGSLIPQLELSMIAEPLPKILGCSMAEIQPYVAKARNVFDELRRTQFVFFKHNGKVDDFLRKISQS